MAKVSDLFEIEYPKTLIYSEQIEDTSGINFISSKGTNNGIVSKVRRIQDRKIYPPNIITVPLKGTVMYACLQEEHCYVAHQIAVLYPKKEMTLNEKMFYCLSIRANKFRYNYGRQADRTLKDIIIPDLDQIPSWVYTTPIPEIENITESYNESNGVFEERKELKKEKLHVYDDKNWKEFRLGELFDLQSGKGPLSKDAIENKGDTPFVSSTAQNNGVTCYTCYEATHKGNVITINKNGSVGEAFYQKSDFCATSDVVVAVPKFTLNPHLAMFVICLIKKEKYRFNYGRKWNLDRMNSSTIKLPTTPDGSPDWLFMENYIKSLKYSGSI
jgi:hypothetical protein